MKGVSVNCGDWHLGWGLGGKDKIGTLSKTEEGVYVWKGHSQGRHGSKWNLKASAYFTMEEDKPRFLEINGSIPRVSELFKGVLDLDLEIEEKLSRKARETRKKPTRVNSNVQLKLF